VLVAKAVGRQEQEDEPLGLAAVAGAVDVEMPVERASLGVEAVAVVPQPRAAHDPPGRAACVAVEPRLERERAGGGAAPAALGVVVAVVVDR
jgi:hypothetical protein